MMDARVDQFETMFDCYYDRIRAFLRRRVGNMDDASDLASDTFVKALEHIDSIPSQDNVLPWLYRIARNSYIDMLRRRKRLRWVDWDEFLIDHLPRLAAADNTEEDVITRSNLPEIRKMLNVLSERQRVCLVLYEYAGLPQSLIAQMLGTNSNVVKVSISNAKKRLRSTARVRAGEEGSEE